jgi:hypothetical protein
VTREDVKDGQFKIVLNNEEISLYKLINESKEFREITSRLIGTNYGYRLSLIEEYNGYIYKPYNYYAVNWYCEIDRISQTFTKHMNNGMTVTTNETTNMLLKLFILDDSCRFIIKNKEITKDELDKLSDIHRMINMCSGVSDSIEKVIEQDIENEFELHYFQVEKEYFDDTYRIKYGKALDMLYSGTVGIVLDITDFVSTLSENTHKLIDWDDDSKFYYNKDLVNDISKDREEAELTGVRPGFIRTLDASRKYT